MKTVFLKTGMRFPKGTSREYIRTIIRSEPPALFGKLGGPKLDAVCNGERVKLVVHIGKNRALVSARFSLGYQLLATLDGYIESRTNPHWEL